MVQPIQGEGLKLELEKYIEVNAYWNSTPMWEQESQNLILDPSYSDLQRFLPRAKKQGDSILFTLTRDGKDVAGSSSAARAGKIPQKELLALHSELRRLQAVADDPRTDDDKRKMIEALEFPDPNELPEFYRIYGPAWDRKLLVVWGFLKKQGRGSRAADLIKPTKAVEILGPAGKFAAAASNPVEEEDNSAKGDGGSEQVGRAGLPRWLPWVAIIALLGLLLFGLGRCGRDDPVPVPHPDQDVVVDCEFAPDDPICDFFAATEDFCKDNPSDPSCVVLPVPVPPPSLICEEDPQHPSCKVRERPTIEDCELNPSLPGCLVRPLPSPEPPRGFCVQYPNDPACNSPLPVPSVPYCQEYPNDPACRPVPVPPPSYCEVYPNDPDCRQSIPLPDLCREYPNDPRCGEPPPRIPTLQFCEENPQHPQCVEPILPLCTEFPNDPRCGATPPLSNQFCEENPRHPRCQENIRPEPPTTQSSGITPAVTIDTQERGLTSDGLIELILTARVEGAYQINRPSWSVESLPVNAELVERDASVVLRLPPRTEPYRVRFSSNLGEIGASVEVSVGAVSETRQLDEN